MTTTLPGRIPRRALLALLPVGAALWLGALVLAPWAASREPTAGPTVELAATVYVAGGLVCHQQPARSFHLWGVRLPVCARCCGLYLGGFIGLLMALLSRPWACGRRAPPADPARRWRWLILGAAAPTAVVTLLERADILPGMTGNWARALSGLALGAAVGWVFQTALGSWPGPRS